MDTLRAALDALPMPATEYGLTIYADGNWFRTFPNSGYAAVAIRAAHRDGARLALERAVALCDVLRDHYASQNRPATEDAMLFAGICDYADALRAQLKELDQ